MTGNGRGALSSMAGSILARNISAISCIARRTSRPRHRRACVNQHGTIKRSSKKQFENVISTEVLHRRRPSLPTCLRAALSCIQREGPSGFGFGIASRSCGSGKIFAGSKSLGTLRMRLTNAGGTTEIEVCSSLSTRIGGLGGRFEMPNQPQYARRVARSSMH